MRLSGACIFGASAATVTATAVIAGLIVGGFPGYVRKAKLDGQRVDDMMNISQTIYANREMLGAPPKTLEEVLNLPSRRYSHPHDLVDPGSGQRYDYQITGDFTYNLCATFDFSSDEDARVYRPVPPAWSHGAGRHCFPRDLHVDPH